MNSHYLALSSLIPLFFFLAILPPSYCTDDERFVECSRPFDCGSFKDISYPFWDAIRPVQCGREGFELECVYGQYLIIRFEKLVFHVLNINKALHIMTIKRLDLWENPCSPNFLNITLDSRNFHYYPPNDINMTLFYGCQGPSVNELGGPNFSCSGDTRYFVSESFPGNHDLFEGCKTIIKVPILRTALIDEFVGGVEALKNVLNQGFDVDYRNDWSIMYCSECEKSGGKCGSDPSNPFRCFCRDGAQPLVCSGNVCMLVSLLTFGLG